MVARGQVHLFDALGSGSNGDAEWLALLAALEVAQSLGAGSFDLLGDSRAVIEQASGLVPCRSPAAKAYRARFEAAAATQPPRRLRWIPRAQNLAGIALARRASGHSGWGPRNR